MQLARSRDGPDSHLCDMMSGAHRGHRSLTPSLSPSSLLYSDAYLWRGRRWREGRRCKRQPRPQLPSAPLSESLMPFSFLFTLMHTVVWHPSLAVAATQVLVRGVAAAAAAGWLVMGESSVLKGRHYLQLFILALLFMFAIFTRKSIWIYYVRMCMHSCDIFSRLLVYCPRYPPTPVISCVGENTGRMCIYPCPH